MVDTFVYSDGAWQILEQPIIAEIPVVSSNFGRSLATSSHSLFVGAPYDHAPTDPPTDFAGTVHVLPLDSSNGIADEDPKPVELVPQLE